MHHLRNKAIPAGPFSDFDKILSLSLESQLPSLQQNLNLIGIVMWP